MLKQVLTKLRATLDQGVPPEQLTIRSYIYAETRLSKVVCAVELINKFEEIALTWPKVSSHAPVFLVGTPDDYLNATYRTAWKGERLELLDYVLEKLS